MPTDIVFRYQSTKDESFHRQMTEDFIAMVKHFNAFVIENAMGPDKAETSFEAVASGLVIHVCSAPKQFADRIRQAFSPIKAALNRTMPKPEHGYDLSTGFITTSEIEELPHRIAEAERTAALSDYVCSNCHRTFVLHSSQRCCVFCGAKVIKRPHGDLLKVCLECPGCVKENGDQDSIVYAHEFQHCPRCGQKLLTLEDEPEDWEYQSGHPNPYADFHEELIQRLGVPLDEFDFAGDVRRRYGKPKT